MMKAIKKHQKQQLCIRHREDVYLHALEKVMDGTASPAYATERWKKLKEVKG
ncbi:hypothetical protein LCGC14_0543820 [marine sediment metagenome]|uniref:Uncharacterized protein n=1 Tax=marine sediment metagenome TaxID=412755 RepID=A0A0F9V0C9_9ZZZZ